MLLGKGDGFCYSWRGYNISKNGRCEMRKKTKKAKRITKQTQLKVRTGVKSGLGEKCSSDADCPMAYEVCFEGECVIWL